MGEGLALVVPLEARGEADVAEVYKRAGKYRSPHRSAQISTR